MQETGIFYDIPFEEYIKIEAISKSVLHKMRKCERFFDYELNKEKDEEKNYFVEGHAAHTRTFEPDLFDKQFAVAPKVDRRTKAGKETWAKFVADNTDKEILSTEQYDMVCGLTDSVRDHPRVQSLLQDGRPEVTAITHDQRYDSLVKTRIDWLTGNFVLADLKTTARGADLDSVKREIFERGYFLQAGMYLGVASAELGADLRDFVFIFVEKSPPYLVGVYRADDKMVAAGKSLYLSLMERYAMACRSGLFPHYNNNDIVDVGLEPWMTRKLGDLIDQY